VEGVVRLPRTAAGVGAAALLGLLGCLDDPPTFAPRGQVPPFILAGEVDPPLAAIYDGPSRFGINVPFRSEDVSIDLEGRLYLDLVPGAAGGNAKDNVQIPAGNIEEVRYVQMDWNQSVPRGCHSLTLILTYVGNYDLNGLPRDDTRAARVIWWLNIGDTEGDVRMSECPGASQVDAVTGGR
jgi:hypothetical protein